MEKKKKKEYTAHENKSCPHPHIDQTASPRCAMCGIRRPTAVLTGRRHPRLGLGPAARRLQPAADDVGSRGRPGRRRAADGGGAAGGRAAGCRRPGPGGGAGRPHLGRPAGRQGRSFAFAHFAALRRQRRPQRRTQRRQRKGRLAAAVPRQHTVRRQHPGGRRTAGPHAPDDATATA